MVRFAIDEVGADLVLLGLLMPNDTNPFDTAFVLEMSTSSLPYQLAGALFSPDALSEALFVLYERFATQGIRQARFLEGMTRLVDTIEASGRPVLLYAYFISERDAREVARLAKGVSNLSWLGVLRPPTEGGPWFIPGDGHPTGKGNEWFAEQLLGHVACTGSPQRPVP